MTTIASWGASGVYVWMSEYPGGQCECETCMKEGQFQAEARSAVTAWRNARKEYPDLKLRIFFGAGGFTPGEKWFPDYPERAVAEILATMPKEVRMCVSMGIKDGVLEDYVGQGGLVTRCFIVSLSSWDYYSCAHIRNRMQELLAKRVHGVSQYFDGCAEDVRGTLDLQLSALAEYSWNTNGRSIREFAESWATRHGCRHPMEFGEWMSLMSRMVAESRSMDKFIWSGSWLKELSGVLAGEKKSGACEGVNPLDHSIEDCRTAFEWSKFFESRELPLRAEVLVRTVAFRGANSIDDSIADCRKAVELAGRLESKQPFLHAELLLRYCTLERAARDLIEICCASENDNVPQTALDDFKEAMQGFLKALNARTAGTNASPHPADSLRKDCIANLEKGYRDALGSVRQL